MLIAPLSYRSKELAEKDCGSVWAFVSVKRRTGICAKITAAGSILSVEFIQLVSELQIKSG
jgi:hypothetical protein